MKKLATIAMAASVFMMPFAANAVTDGSYKGQVAVQKGIQLTCQLTVGVSGSGTLATLGLGGINPLCYLVAFTGTPYPASFSGTTSGTYTITGVDVTTITSGDCAGDASGTWSGTTINVNAVLPAKVAGTGDCVILGAVSK